MGWSACRSTMEGPHPEGPNHRNRGRTPRRGQSSGGVDAPRSGLEDVPPAATARLAARRAPSPSSGAACGRGTPVGSAGALSTRLHAPAQGCLRVGGLVAYGEWAKRCRRLAARRQGDRGGRGCRAPKRALGTGDSLPPRRLAARRAPSPNSGAACSVAVPTSSAGALGTLTTLHRIPPGTRTSAVWRAVADFCRMAVCWRAERSDCDARASAVAARRRAPCVSATWNSWLLAASAQLAAQRS